VLKNTSPAWRDPIILSCPSASLCIDPSLDAVLGSGLVLAERLGAMTGMGSRGRYTRRRPPRTRPKIRRHISAAK
jgi:hypothetical protein